MGGVAAPFDLHCSAQSEPPRRGGLHGPGGRAQRDVQFARRGLVGEQRGNVVGGTEDVWCAWTKPGQPLVMGHVHGGAQGQAALQR